MSVGSIGRIAEQAQQKAPELRALAPMQRIDRYRLHEAASTSSVEIDQGSIISPSIGQVFPKTGSEPPFHNYSNTSAENRSKSLCFCRKNSIDGGNDSATCLIDRTMNYGHVAPGSHGAGQRMSGPR
ncbi:MAG TPA: hypothetical protein K8W01_20050 [Methylorubrum populi]|uniref:Uncharacterized protein n=1 Tax=Methylorubrum populi TaxID=223967 RepID=A0A921E6G6_9HYPH|nr:hypothetical protein [Methylorubrum populi]